MSTPSGAHYIAIITFMAMFLLILAGCSSSIVFQATNVNTDESIFEKKVEVGEEFTLAYIHSVTKQPVYEVFKVDDNKTLALVEMRYDSFGANLPVGPEKLAEEETVFIVEDDHYKILYENRKFSKVPLRVGKVIADHRIIFADGTELRFLDKVEGGNLVEFYVKPSIAGLN